MLGGHKSNSSSFIDFLWIWLRSTHWKLQCRRIVQRTESPYNAVGVVVHVLCVDYPGTSRLVARDHQAPMGLFHGRDGWRPFGARKFISGFYGKLVFYGQLGQKGIADFTLDSLQEISWLWKCGRMVQCTVTRWWNSAQMFVDTGMGWGRRMMRLLG